MITLTTPIFDILGELALQAARIEDTGGITRRVIRTATLDGGAVSTDMGYSAADRTLQIVQANATQSQFDRAHYLLRNYGGLILAAADGVFSVALQKIKTDDANMVLTVLVLSQLSES